jgi:hypothetical protein
MEDLVWMAYRDLRVTVDLMDVLDKMALREIEESLDNQVCDNYVMLCH